MKFIVLMIVLSLTSASFAESVVDVVSRVAASNCTGENSRQIHISELKTKLDNLKNAGTCKVYDTKYYNHISDSGRVTSADGSDVPLLILRVIDDLGITNTLTSGIMLIRGKTPICLTEKEGVETISYDFDYQSGEYTFDWQGLTTLLGKGIKHIDRKTVIQIVDNNLEWLGTYAMDVVDSVNPVYTKWPEIYTYQCGSGYPTMETPVP